MWLILGGTLAVAALVDRHRQAQLEIRLGDAVSISGYTIQVPQGWLEESPEGRTDTVALREPGMDQWGRTIQINISKPTPLSLFKLLSSTSSGSVDTKPVSIRFGDGDGKLTVRRIDDDERFNQLTGVHVYRFIATRELAGGLFATLELEDIGQLDKRERARDINLVKQIAATLKTESAPTQ